MSIFLSSSTPPPALPGAGPLLRRYNGVRKGALSQNSSYSASFCSSHRPHHRAFPLFRHLAGGSFSHAVGAAGTAVRFLWTGIAVKRACAPVFKKAKFSGQVVSQRSNDLHPLCPPHVSGSALAPFPRSCSLAAATWRETNSNPPSLPPEPLNCQRSICRPTRTRRNTSHPGCQTLHTRAVEHFHSGPSSVLHPNRPNVPHGSPNTPRPSHQTPRTRFVKRPAPASPMPYAPLAPRPHPPNTFPSSSPFQKGRRAVHCGGLFSPGKHKIIFF